MFGLERFLVGAVVSIALLAASFGIGYWQGYHAGVNATEAKWKLLRADWENASRAHEQMLRERGDALAAELEVAKSKVRIETVEVIRTVYRKASSTRACFSPDITEALNRAATIRETVDRPGAPVQTIEHKVGGTSELAAAEWAANARAEHEACRQQVAKLGEWIRALTGSKP